MLHFQPIRKAQRPLVPQGEVTPPSEESGSADLFFSGAGAVVLRIPALTCRGSVCDEGGRGLGDVPLAAVPRVSVYRLRAAVRGERAAETRHAAMETALLCTSVNHSVTPETGRQRHETEREVRSAPSRQRRRRLPASCFLPVVTLAVQAAVVTGPAVNTAALAPGGGRVSVVGANWFVKVVEDGQMGG